MLRRTAGPLLLAALLAPSTAVAAPTPNERAATELARVLTTSDDVRARVRATRAALARSGVPTRTIVRPRIPRSLFSVSPLISAAMALESDGRLTLADVVRAHTNAGLYPSRQAGADRLRRLLRILVRGARQRPRNPLSFGPLFLAKMAKAQSPSVDLMDSYVPKDLRLTAVEVQVLAATIERAMRMKVAGTPAVHTRARLAAKTPCSDLEKQLERFVPLRDTLPGGVLYESGKEVVDDEVSIPKAIEYYEQLLEEAGYTRQNRKYAERTFEAWKDGVKAIDTIQLLDATYGRVTVESTHPEGVHKPTKPHERPFTFYASVGMSDDEWRAFLDAIGGERRLDDWSALRDCLKKGGVTLPESPAGIGKYIADNARVRWTIRESETGIVRTELTDPPEPWSNPTPVIDGKVAGGLIYPIEMQSPVRGTGTLTVDTQTEPAHPDDACAPETCRKGRVTAEAEIIGLVEPPISDAPTVQDIKGWLTMLRKLELRKVLGELGIDWARTMLPPSASATVEVTWHAPGAYEIAATHRFVWTAVPGTDVTTRMKLRTCGSPSWWGDLEWDVLQDGVLYRELSPDPFSVTFGDDGRGSAVIGWADEPMFDARVELLDGATRAKVTLAWLDEGSMQPTSQTVSVPVAAVTCGPAGQPLA